MCVLYFALFGKLKKNFFIFNAANNSVHDVSVSFQNFGTSPNKKGKDRYSKFKQMSLNDQEFINIGFGHASCHLITQFYNIEESVLQQQLRLKNCRASHNVNLHCQFDLVNRTASYTPRTILYDTKNSGNYKDNWITNANEIDVGLFQTIHTNNDSVVKSDFQKILDSGKTPESLALLDKSHNFKHAKEFEYWTNYNKFLLKSQNLIISDDWYHYRNKNGDAFIPTNIPVKEDENNTNDYFKHFIQPDAGKQEYDKTKYEFWDDKFHHWIEKCDNFKHFNIFAEFDDAWGSLNSNFLEELRDEFNKTTVFQYSLSCSNISKVDVTQSIKTSMFVNNIINTIESTDFVDLLFPLSYEINSYEDNLFESSSRNALLFQTINSVFDQKEGQSKITPNEIIRRLTFNNNASIREQKIVCSMKVNENMEFNYITNFEIPKNFQYNNFKTWKLKNGENADYHVYGKVDITRSESVKDKPDVIKTYDLDKRYLNTFLSKNSFIDIKNVSLEMSENKKFINTLKYWMFYIIKNKNYIKRLMFLSEDYINELIEKMHTLIKSYKMGNYFLDIEGFELSEEEDDDY